MGMKFEMPGKSLTESVALCATMKWSRAALQCGYLIIILLTFGLLASQAQPIQPEVLFEFPYGIGSYLRGPEYPYGNLVEGSDGNFYGTTSGGGPSNAG